MNGCLLAGVDEAGRGPLAGPVVTAAVILPENHGIDGLGDSKRLTAARREALVPLIQARAVAWAMGRAEPAEIDAVNILQATMRAMARAVAALGIPPEAVWVDGDRCPDLPVPAQAVVGGDGSVAAISAASILAKVARDAEMAALDATFPGYGFGAHKGYGTAEHRTALARLGPCAAHRMSFAPVREAAAARQAQMPLDWSAPGPTQNAEPAETACAVPPRKPRRVR